MQIVAPNAILVAFGHRGRRKAFRAGQTRTNNAILALGAGAIDDRPAVPGAPGVGSLNLVIDAVGWFE